MCGTAYEPCDGRTDKEAIEAEDISIIIIGPWLVLGLVIIQLCTFGPYADQRQTARKSVRDLSFTDMAEAQKPTSKLL